MAIFFLPSIKTEDYDAFRRIINADFPDTLDVWAYETSKRVAQITGSGGAARLIEVNPDEFTSYLRNHGRRANRNELDNFAVHKSGLQSD